MSTVLLLMAVLLDSVAVAGCVPLVVPAWFSCCPARRSDGRAAPLVGPVPGAAVAARHRVHDRGAQLPGEAGGGGGGEPPPEAPPPPRGGRGGGSLPGRPAPLRPRSGALFR